MKRLIALALIGIASFAHGQCAPGILGAGNPGCSPPSAPNSPYNQGGTPGSPGAPKAVWLDSWGAVALDENMGLAGNVEGADSKSEASGTAISYCEKNGGRDCQLFISYYNQCAALAQPQGGGSIAAYTAGKRSEAEEGAIERCGGQGRCIVVLSKCSYARQAK